MKQNILPMKCAICGREGSSSSFKVCPVCNRLIGRECWQPKYSGGNPADTQYPNCKHRLQIPKGKRAIIDS
jgi:hypothetical protein